MWVELDYLGLSSYVVMNTNVRGVVFVCSWRRGTWPPILEAKLKKKQLVLFSSCSEIRDAKRCKDTCIEKRLVKEMGFQMGGLSSVLPDELVLGAIWPKLCQVAPWKKRYKLFHSLCLYNKVWKHVVDHNQEWFHSKLQICIIHFD